jgi:hypothetical protein
MRDELHRKAPPEYQRSSTQRTNRKIAQKADEGTAALPAISAARRLMASHRLGGAINRGGHCVVG